MSKFTSATIAALLLSSSTYAFAQVADRSYYGSATVSSPGSGQFFVRDRYTAANARSYQGLDPVPIRVGAFEAQPVLLISARSRSNVLLDDVNEQSDTLIVVRPSISAATTWSRHRIGFDASVTQEEYLDLSDQSATQYGFRGFGQLDVSSNFAVAGSVMTQNLRESRIDIGGTSNPAERVEIDRNTAEANALHSANRLRVRGQVSVSDNDYNDTPLQGGGFIDQDVRDNQETQIGVGAEYAVTRNWALVGAVSHVDRDYDPVPPLSGLLDRDISGVTFRAGANFELPVNLRGQVSAQFQDFDPADPALSNIQQTGLNASVQWFPTQLTTARFTASQSVADAGNTNDANAIVTRYGAGVDHELLRSLVLSSGMYFETREFNPSNREDEQTSFNVGATWKMNSNIHVRGGYRFVTQDSLFDPFDDNVFTLSVRFFP